MLYRLQPMLGQITTWIFNILAFIGTVMWLIWDNIFLLQMGHAYSLRFRKFSMDQDVEAWRNDQQQEWDRMSTTLGLLATMHAAILAVQPHAPPFAYAVWLAGAGLSICGLFIVQYFPIRAFPLSNQEIRHLVDDDQSFNRTLLAAVVASPVIITLWASILFAIGIVDYLAESDLGGKKYRILAFIPVCLGFAAVLGTLTIGEIIRRRIESQDQDRP